MAIHGEVTPATTPLSPSVDQPGKKKTTESLFAGDSPLLIAGGRPASLGEEDHWIKLPPPSPDREEERELGFRVLGLDPKFEPN